MDGWSLIFSSLSQTIAHRFAAWLGDNPSWGKLALALLMAIGLLVLSPLAFLLELCLWGLRCARGK